MVADSLKRYLSWTEEQMLRAIAKTVPNGGTVVISEIADQIHVTRSVGVTALRKAALAGIVETRSLGSKGTMIIVHNRETWDALVQEEAR